MFDLPTEQIPISALTPYENNAKKHPKEQVQTIIDSIREFGMLDPIGVWGPSNLIVEGHGRLLACKKLRYKTVPVIRLDHLSDEQRRAYTLAHNKTTMNSDFDTELLNTELSDIVDIDMSLYGFDLDLDNAEVVEDDFEPELPEEPVTKQGDIWILGRHRLMCGDSTKEQDVASLMNGQLADMYLTDPPYNVDYTGKTKDALKIENDAMSDETYREFLQKAFTQADGAMKAGAVFYIWHADSVEDELQPGLGISRARRGFEAGTGAKNTTVKNS